jgi:putative phosphoribosyl transferase
VYFTDRRDAGRQLADRLERYITAAGDQGGDLAEPLVLALPRGGLPIGAEISERLGIPLDVLVARKIGAPGQPELGIGALAGEDPPLFDRRSLELLGLVEEDLGADVARARTEMHRREDLYRGRRPAPRLTGRRVILVDDGLATGMTAMAALRHLRRARPVHVVLAVPVAAPDAVERLRTEADDVVCLHQPVAFRGVGEWYADFRQTTDDEVIAHLHGMRHQSR